MTEVLREKERVLPSESLRPLLEKTGAGKILMPVLRVIKYGGGL